MSAYFKTVSLLLFFPLFLLSCGSLNSSAKNQKIPMDHSTSLLEAVGKRDVNLVTKILTSKPNLELKDGKSRTALMLATYNNDTEIAKLLIVAGADVNAQDNMLNSPFLYAGANGNLALVKMCLANGANFNVFNRYGGSALIPAAERRHLDVVNLLVNTPGYPINHINNLGWTALLEAIILGEKSKIQLEVVKLLVKGGCDVNIADKDGVSPLAHARKRSMNELVNILTEAGAR
jgi:hypothetical protein